MTTIDLKPCPFCRKNAARIDSGLLDGRYGEERWYQVECQQCCARGPTSNNSAYDATEAWRKVGALHIRVKTTKAEVTRLRAELAQARAEADAAGYRRAIDEACALLDAQHDEIAGRGPEWAYDDGMLYALDVAEQAVRALAPVEPVSAADELPGEGR